MKKKGDPVNRALESVYKLALDKSFREKIRQIRVDIGIPSEGFGDKNEEKSTFYSSSVIPCAIEVLRQYHLDPTYYAEMTHYIRFNRFNEQRSRKDASVEIRYPDRQLVSNSEKAYRKLKQPYVAVYILDGSSAANVTDIIKDHWDKIRKSIKTQGGNVLDIKTSLNKERNHLMVLLIEKSRAELCEMIGATTADPAYKYKDDLIAAVMKHEFGYSVSADLVRKYSAKPKLNVPTDKKQLSRSHTKRRQ